MAGVKFWCRWWPYNSLSVRTSANDPVPEGLWFAAYSDIPEEELSSGAHALLDENAIRQLHTLLGNWLTSREWPTRWQTIGTQQPDPGPDDDWNDTSYDDDPGFATNDQDIA